MVTYGQLCLLVKSGGHPGIRACWTGQDWTGWLSRPSKHLHFAREATAGTLAIDPTFVILTNDLGGVNSFRKCPDKFHILFIKTVHSGENLAWQIRGHAVDGLQGL